MAIENSQQSGHPNSNVFIYQEIANQLEAQIRSGNYPPHSRLPSMDNLSKQFHVNKLTIIKAIKTLIRRGLVYTQPARGTFVAPFSSPPSSSDQPSTNIWAGSSLRTIGVISRVMVPDQTGFFHRELLEKLRSLCAHHQINLSLIPASNLTFLEDLLRTIESFPLEALICVGPFADYELHQIQQLYPRMILLDHHDHRVPATAICQDNIAGGYQAIHYFLQKGYEKIAVVKGADEQLASQERLTGAYMAWGESGRAKRNLIVIPGDFREQTGYQATEHLFSHHLITPPCAIFYCNDEMALGGLNYLRSKNFRIPEDVAIIGYDDVALAKQPAINLTTIHAPIEAMAQLTFDYILNFPNLKVSYLTITLGTYLVLRGTTPA